MIYNENISSLKRYLINDEDRSGKLRLDKNELNMPFPDGFIDEIHSFIDDYIIQAYPSTWNTLESASALLEHDNCDEILIVPGSDYGLKLCYESLLINGKGKVGLPAPTYAMNEVYANISGAAIREFKYDKDFKLNKKEVFESLKKINMFILANPNQPTGLLEEDDFIFELIDRAKKNNVWIIIDEAYYSYSKYSAVKYIKDYDNLIITRSFSKSYGIAGLRTGALISNKSNVDYLSKALPVYCINSISLKILEILIKYKDRFDIIHNELISSRDDIIKYYSMIGCKSFKSDTNFVMNESNNIFQAKDYIDFLKKNNIMIRGPWSKYPYIDAFRISSSSKENLKILKKLTDKFICS